MCPRCGQESLAKLAESPVTGVWEVHQCELCFYSWRSTEPARRTQRAQYPEPFRMTRAEVDAAQQMPVVPALRAAR